MTYDRNKVVTAIYKENKKLKRHSTHVFNPFTGKIYARELFIDEIKKFEDEYKHLLRPDFRQVSWFDLHNLLCMNYYWHPLFINNEYIGAKMGDVKGFMKKKEIEKSWKKRDYK